LGSTLGRETFYAYQIYVCDEQLQAALSEANVKPDALLKHSSNGHFLELKYFEKESLRVVQGRDLVLAGRHLLPVEKRWWNIRLYAEGIKSSFGTFHIQIISYTRADFHEIEHYLSRKDIPSGEAFRMLRMCQLHRRPDEEQWWWRGISNSTATHPSRQLSERALAHMQIRL
jgi:hypothetical protein